MLSPKKSIRQRGQALVEMALVTPILLMMVLGVAELGHLYNNYIAVVNTARDGARLAARGNVYSDPDLLFVMRSHAGTLDLNANASVIVTNVKTKDGVYEKFTSRTIIGAGGSEFSPAQLKTKYETATPASLRTEEFVLVEVRYTHHPFSIPDPTQLAGILSWIPSTVTLYSYTFMPVSAPS